MQLCQRARVCFPAVHFLKCNQAAAVTESCTCLYSEVSSERAEGRMTRIMSVKLNK